MAENSTWKTLTSNTVYQNPWIAVHHRDVISPKGAKGIYGVVEFKNIAIAIVPLDDKQNTWLVGQDRYVLNRYSWELPEGGCPINESPIEAAKRELMEETGIKAKSWFEILKMDISNSVTNEQSISFIAKGLMFEQAQPDETELLQVRKLPFHQVVEMVLQGQITDSLSIATILKTDYLMKNQLPPFEKAP